MGQCVKGIQRFKLGALALAGALLLSACGGGGPPASATSELSSASPVQPADSAAAGVGSPLPESGQPTRYDAIRDAVMALPYGWDAEGEGWRGVLEPYLDYEVVEPLHTYTYTGTFFLAYLNVFQNGLWGTLSFDGSVVFALEEGLSIGVCGDDHAHGGSYRLNGLFYEDPDAYRAEMDASGFPLDFWGGHGGGGGYTVLVHPDSGEKALIYGSDGPGFSMEPDRFDHLLQILPYTIAPSEMAPDFSNYWELLGTDVDTGHAYQYGLMDTGDFSVIVPNEYDGISDLMFGYYTLRKGDRFAYFSLESEKMITDAIYDYTWFGEGEYGRTWLGFFNEGYCPVMREGKYGFIDAQGVEVVPPQFDGATHVFGGRAWVKQNGLWGMIEIVA